MMIYSIRDQGAKFFILPFCAPTDKVAIRMFIQSLGDSFPHRGDFDLCRIGAFDTESGIITANDPVRVCAGLSIDPKYDPRGVGEKALQPETVS